MIKNILNLEGAEELSVSEQKSTLGGIAPLCDDGFTAKRCTEFGTVPAYWSCLPVNYVGSC